MHRFRPARFVAIVAPDRADQPKGRMIRPLLLGTALLACAACAGPGTPRPTPQADLSSELVPVRGDTPPRADEGACWARDVTPAVIETQAQQEVVAPARPAQDGAPRPATFQTVTRQKIVQDRREVWFRTPCEAEMTVAFVASLQRALKARGHYEAAVTGRMDAPTAAAIRAYQAPLGLDSPVLSLAAARAMGIAPADPRSY